MLNAGTYPAVLVQLNDSTKSAFKAILRGVSGLLFGIGGISFLFGGRAIREVTKADLVLSEMVGIFVAIVCLGLGALAKSVGEEDEPVEDSIDQ